MWNVYIADDSVVVRSKLKDALEEEGVIKVIGNSGDAQDAITEISTLDLQAVIIDIRMPGGGGMPILRDIKSQKTGPLAIILTSFPDSEYREIYMTNGADYFFDKAKDIPQMVNLLNELAYKNGEQS